MFFVINKKVIKNNSLFTVAKTVVITIGLPVYTSGVQKCTGKIDNLKKIQILKISKLHNSIGLYSKSKHEVGICE